MMDDDDDDSDACCRLAFYRDTLCFVRRLPRRELALNTQQHITIIAVCTRYYSCTQTVHVV